MSSVSEGACDFDDEDFDKRMRRHIWRTDAALVVSFALVAILVGVGSYSRRYRRHALIRLLSLGASALFLPIVSYVASGIGKENCSLPEEVSECLDDSTFFLLAWASLVHLVGVNSCTTIVADDDEGRNIGPTMQLLVGAIWISYLAVSDFKEYEYSDPTFVYCLVSIPCVLSLVKILLKLYAFEKARRSFALGRNPRLIAGYMDQLQDESPHVLGDELVIPLVVMGEDMQQVEEGPRGYRFRDKRGNDSLVTINRVRNMASTDDVLCSRPPLKDLCSSFSLFKLLRRRFARCPVVEAGGIVPNFVLNLLDGDPESILKMVADELSFACDFYYSCLPVSYSSLWLPILNTIVSIFGIAYCLGAGIMLVRYASRSSHGYSSQIYCQLKCDEDDDHGKGFGNILFPAVLTFFLVIAVLLAEAWEIISYMCSNWTKVTLICYYITKTQWQQSPLVRRLIRFMLRCRCNLLYNWGDKMGQTSILDTNQKIGLVVSLRRLLRLPDQTKHVKIPTQVKVAIFDTLKTSNWRLSNGIASLQHCQIGNNFLWACNGEGLSDVIIVWHIATCIFEIRHPHGPPSAHSIKDKITATHLSHYCAYLLASASELLPDDKAWSKKSYKSVKKIVEPIFSSVDERPLEYERIILLLGEKSKDSKVLDRGVTLGKQMVDGIEDEEMGWRVLSGFWSEMILYIAPSDNIKAHGKAIARGGELITILWALLTHAGIISRPSTATNV